METNYKEWIKRAKDDKLSIQAILKENGPTNTVCFLSQQMAEKYLKALMVFHHKKFPKVHDLLKLESLVEKINPDIRELDNEIDILNRYYIKTRYPGDYPEFNEDNAKEAFNSALKIEEFVLKIINPKQN